MTVIRRAPLNVHNASISTASVTVRLLTIDKKQVTLAVFRQLIEEPLIDFKTLKFHGTPWGHVRYLVDEPERAARHIVWQKGDELRRCIVLWRAKIPARRRSVLHLGELIVSPLPRDWHRCANVPVEIRCQAPREFGYNSDDDEFWDYPASNEPDDSDVPEIDARHFREEELIAKATHWAERERQREIKRLDAYLQNYDKLVAPLFDLPQLFIAV